MFNNYLKMAIRNITKHKIYSLINIVGLATGIACAVLIMLWVKYELSYDKFHENADRLYRVGFTTEQKDYYGFFEPGPLAKHLEDNFPEIEKASNYMDMQFKLSHETKGFFCKGGIVSPDFFKMFSFPLEEGNSSTVLTTPNSIVISRSLAVKMFGQSNPVGKTLKINDNSGLNVTGVFSDVPKTSSIQFDFVLPLASAPDYMRMWDRKCTNTYVMLQENASFDEINKKIYGEMNKHNPTWKNVLFLYPLTKSHLYAPGKIGSIIYVYIFSLFGILILIVACINFMNLATARSEKRMKEIGIKKTVGSTRLELIKQFMIETIMLSFISLLLSVVLVEFSLPYLNNVLGAHIKLNFSMSMILILLGISLLTGLIAGSYPAIYLSSLTPMKVLSGKKSNLRERRSSLIRNSLVIAQFSFTIFIITCVLFIGKQLNFIQSKDLGFNKEQVLVISARGALQQNISTVKNELLKFPFIQSATVSATNLTNFEGAGTGPINWEGKNTDKVCEVGFNFVDEDFAKTFQIKMAQGRFFSREYSTDMADAFVVNETAVKEMGIKNPVNKNLVTWFGRKGKIVGVIRDFNTEALRNEMAPVVFIPTEAANYLCLRISSKDITGAIKSLENKIKELVPDDPFEYRFLDDEINSQYKTEQMTGELATFIAVLSIFISCLGLFGLASFYSEKRTKEIGIRKVLGASVSNVLLLLTKDFTKWVLLANIIAWPLSWYAMNAWLQNFAYRIELKSLTFIFAGILVFAIAMLTIIFHVIKAATANPIEALRYE
jgi:putative ABC transport system permease protein